MLICSISSSQPAVSVSCIIFISLAISGCSGLEWMCFRKSLSSNLPHISILPMSCPIMNLKRLPYPSNFRRALSTMSTPSFSGTWKWWRTRDTGMHWYSAYTDEIDMLNIFQLFKHFY